MSEKEKEGVQEGACIVDALTHQVQEVEEDFARILGKEKEELLHKSLGTLLEEGLSYSQNPLQLESGNGILLTRNKDASRFYGRIIRLENEGGVRFTLKALPSDREGSLDEGDLFYEMSRDLLIKGDFQIRQFLRVNPSFYRLLGYTQEEVLNTDIFQFVHPDDREGLMDRLEEMSEGKAVEGFRGRGIRKDGNAIWIEWSGFGEPVEGVFYGIGRKVDEEVRAKQELESIGDWYYTLFESSPVAMLIHDGELVHDLNQEALKLLGRKEKKELLKERIEAHYSFQKGRELLARIQSVINEEGNFHSFPSSFKCPDGKLIELEIDGAPIQCDGKACAYLAFRDVTKRKKAERELERREEEYRTIVEGIPEGIHVLVPENSEGTAFRVEFVNRAFSESRNIPREELVGRDLMSFLKEHGAEELFKPPQRAFLEKRVQDYSGDIWYRGQWRTYQARAIPILDEEENCFRIVTISHDVTEEKKEQEEKERLALIAQETDNLVIMTDPDGLIEWVNEAFIRLTGYASEEIHGQKPGELLQGPDTDSDEVDRLWKTISEERSDVFELLNYTKEGTPYWSRIYLQPTFDENGKLRGFFSIQADVTERRKMEERIRQSERQFRNLVENMNEGILQLDAEFNIQYVNDFLLERLGYKREDLEGKNLIRVVKNMAPQYLNRIWEIFEQRKQGERGQSEFSLKGVEGEWNPFLVSGTPIFDDQGGFQGSIAIFTDLSERKKLEREVLQAVIQTQERERERFAEDLHDGIGQILSAVRMQLNSFEEEEKGGQGERLKEVRSMIENAIDETRAITHDLMPNELRDFGLLKALDNLLERAWKAKGIEVHYHAPDDDVELPENLKIALYRIFQELVNNAIKHSGASSLELEIQIEEGAFYFELMDDGVGFEAFREKEGSGTTNIRRRADLFEGWLDIDSQPGRGTRVKGNIPIPEKSE